MGIRLSEDEAWAMVEGAHTAVLTTLRADGVPVSLPVWFAVVDRAIYVRTPAGAKKVARVRHDERAAFVVESGEAWTELTAVSMTGRAAVVDDPDEAQAATDALDAKYATFGIPKARAPEATRKHYAATAVIRFDPDPRLLTWDNARLRLADPS